MSKRSMPPQLSVTSLVTEVTGFVTPYRVKHRREGGPERARKTTHKHAEFMKPKTKAAPFRRQSSRPRPDQQPTPCPGSSRRRNGKVARLPQDVRERLNSLIRDGLPYADIIAQLGDAGKTLTYHNLVRWRKGGYREWEQRQEHLDALRAKQQLALDALREKDAAKLHEAVLQITATQLCQLMADLNPATLRKHLEADPHNFVRLLTLLPKLTTISLECERQRLSAAGDLPENRSRIRQENLERARRYDAGTLGQPMEEDVGDLADPPAAPNERP